ncbi:hypothetical protein RI054_19g86840 [Pseudoscourfieldia marina]
MSLENSNTRRRGGPVNNKSSSSKITVTRNPATLTKLAGPDNNNKQLGSPLPASPASLQKKRTNTLKAVEELPGKGTTTTTMMDPVIDEDETSLLFDRTQRDTEQHMDTTTTTTTTATTTTAPPYNTTQHSNQNPSPANEWGTVAGIVDDLKLALELARRATEATEAKASVSGTAGFGSHSTVGISDITRKKLTQRAKLDLAAAEKRLASLAVAVPTLQARGEAAGARLLELERGRENLLRKLERAASELHATGSGLANCEIERDGLHASLVELEEFHATKLVELQETRQLSDARTEQAADAESRASRALELQAEAIAARDDATRFAAEAANREARLLDRAEEAQEAADRRATALAQLTADNVALSVALAEEREARSSLMAENSELKDAAEAAKGAWFDRVRSEVADRVSEAEARGDLLESELKRAGAARAASEDSLRREMAELMEKYKATADALAVAREALAAEREMRETSESEAAEESRKRADLEAQLAEALVESKLTDERCRREMEATRRAKDAKDASDGLVREMKGLLRSCEERKEKAENDLADARADLAEQKRVNGVLMHRKEQVEWELLKAMAAGYSLSAEGTETITGAGGAGASNSGATAANNNSNTRSSARRGGGGRGSRGRARKGAGGRGGGAQADVGGSNGGDDDDDDDEI